MTDEKYTFFEELKDKKRTATGAHHKRAHCGKGGAVKFPSDYLSKKELKKMSGEVKSYRLNDPISWEEFKAMPDDIKVDYIRLICKKFNPPYARIAEMFGVSAATFYNWMRTLGCGSGHSRGKDTKWDEKGFVAWRNGVPLASSAEETVDEAPISVEPTEQAMTKAIPRAGKLDFDGGDVDAALNTIRALLAGEDAKICVSWEIMK